MSFPPFFDALPRLTLVDPLARLLGTSTDGRLSYGYDDAVRLAGHSCPAVAGAWLMVVAGLAWLYGDDLPVRGDLDVLMRDAASQGTTGVIASVATLVTGAAAEGGFPGIGPQARHARRGLLAFEAAIDGTMAMRRRDTGAGVILDLDTRLVPHDPAMQALMPRVLGDDASAEEVLRFAALWQDRVRRILVDHADDPRLVHVYDWPAEPGTVRFGAADRPSPARDSAGDPPA